jgi:hypothetical protein
MTFLGEINEARVRGNMQCEAQSVIIAQPCKNNKKGPKTYELGHDSKKSSRLSKQEVEGMTPQKFSKKNTLPVQ